jgi:hypothetical protein
VIAGSLQQIKLPRIELSQAVRPLITELVP